MRLIEHTASAVAIKATIEIGGKRYVVAFHGPGVVANGWEPYDQPHPAAYIPTARENLLVIDGACGRILVGESR